MIAEAYRPEDIGKFSFEILDVAPDEYRVTVSGFSFQEDRRMKTFYKSITGNDKTYHAVYAANQPVWEDYYFHDFDHVMEFARECRAFEIRDFISSVRQPHDDTIFVTQPCDAVRFLYDRVNYVAIPERYVDRHLHTLYMLGMGRDQL